MMKRVVAYLLDLCMLTALAFFLFLLSERPQTAGMPRWCFPALWIALSASILLFEALSQNRKKAIKKNPTATALVLLSDTQRAVQTWELSNLTTFLIGKNLGEGMVGADLVHTEFAAMIDDQHAILNYTPSGWLIEDLATRNGVGIMRPGASGEARLAPGMPYRISPGDIVFIGQDTQFAVK